MRNNEFQKAYLKIIKEQNQLISQGFWSNIKKSIKQKLSDNPDDLYCKTDAGNANDLFATVMKLRQLCTKLGFSDAPLDAFNSLRKYFLSKGASAKGAANALTTADEKIAKQVVQTDKKITDAVNTFKAGIQDGVKAVCNNITNNSLQVIEFIISAIKFSKDKVVAFFQQALQAQKNLAKATYNKIKALITELKNIQVAVISFTSEIAIQIAKILGKIALLQISIIIFVGQKIVEQQKEIFNVAIAKGKEVAAAGKKMFKAVKTEIKTDLKMISKLSDALAVARQQSKQEVAQDQKNEDGKTQQQMA